MAFFCKENTLQTNSLFDLALNNLSNSGQLLARELPKKKQNLAEAKDKSFIQAAAPPGKVEVNSLLTKSVL